MLITEQSPDNRVTHVRLAIIAASLFLVGTNAFVIAGVLPDIADSLDTYTAEVSYSISWYAATVAAAAPAIAVLLANVSRTTLMAGGLGLIAVGTFAAAMATDLTWFTIARVVAGLGGAALVPTATAAAPAMMPVEQRGKALALIGLGFTLATAVGSPLGTALADLFGWRFALGTVAALALLVTLAIAIRVRGLSSAHLLPMGRRFEVLADAKIVLLLLASLLVAIGFNVVYIFSSAVTQEATHGSGSRLAALLLAYGAGGIVGNQLGGRLTDIRGAGPTMVTGLLLLAVVLAVLTGLVHQFGTALAAFTVWGVVTFWVIPPHQHLLVESRPAVAGISLSWHFTAMYAGIAFAPIIGAQLLPHGANAVLLCGAGATATALLVTAAALKLSAGRQLPSETKSTLTPVLRTEGCNPAG